MKNIPDWLIRTIKTFVQAFFGVFIPAGASYLNGGFPASLGEAWVFLAPTLAAALSAGICAAWNIVSEYMGS